MESENSYKMFQILFQILNTHTTLNTSFVFQMLLINSKAQKCKKR